MINPESQHHEAALSLIEQLLLTGALVLPAAKIALHAARQKRANRRKPSQKGTP